ncbi:MAG: AraC family transcriptional regulator [Christensenellaceae bacterium]|jgi:AraC family transcriptional regulator
MDWMTKMNEALSYIEAHLTEEIDMREVAHIAGCSAYHFTRVFSYMAGVNLGEYLRRRRLTLAAFALQQSNEKIIDVALMCGYDSPASFARAFKAMHGLSPSQAKEEGVSFQAYPPISFQISIKGVTAMEYRIEEREAFQIIGYQLRSTMEEDRCYKEIPTFWSENAMNGNVMKLASLMDGPVEGLLGVSDGDWFNTQEVDYYIAVSSTKAPLEGMVSYEVPASKWAIFKCVGPMPTAIQALQKRIVTEWLPTSGYEYGNAPDIEVYGPGDNTKEDFISYVWMPIVEKKEA